MRFIWALLHFLRYEVAHVLKGNFVPCLALARSLCLPHYPLIKLLVTMGRAHRLYPALYEPCNPRLYKLGDQIFVGRGYPLSSREDVIAIVRRCGSEAAQAESNALVQWDQLQVGNESDNTFDIVDETRFDDFIKYVELPSIERELSGPGLPFTAQNQPETYLAIRSYENFSDELKVLVLYLHYRMGRHHRYTIHRLVMTLDWNYLARIISEPFRTVDEFDPERQAATIGAAHRLSDALTGRARQYVLKTLCAQASVAHRALAQEYEFIHGYSFEWSPTEGIQDKLLEHAHAFVGPRNKPEEKLSALCLSGGGIRSASFCLGAIQTLAAHRLFGQFHYLSTVSGGGYIGTALTRWMEAKVAGDGMSPQAALEFAENELARLRAKDYVRDRVAGLQFEQEGALTWLRMNSNYLARRLSLFSADAWTIVATYLRNLLIVWFIFWPWIAAFLLLPWFAVWFGRAGTCSGESCHSMAFGVTGAVIGALGATYFYQGIPDLTELRYANFIGLPKGGDKRAALGALMLVVASFLISHAMWSDVDKGHQPSDTATLLHDYQYILWAIVITQFPLGLGNTEWLAIRLRTVVRSLMAMTLAACLATAVQVVLILAIRLSLDFWRLYLGATPAVPQGISVASMTRALATPALVLLALLVGEAVKAATRSWTEKPDRREHQGRAHAFVFMMLTAWVASAVVVVGVPAVLVSLGGNVPGVTAAGSAVSLAVSTWFGYRKSSPGKPEARTPVSLTLIGSLGMLLLAILVSIAAWKTLEHLALKEDPALEQDVASKEKAVWQQPIHCQCANLLPDQKNQRPPLVPLLPKFELPVSESMCTVASAQCVDRGSMDYIEEIVVQFGEKELRTALGYLTFSAFLFYWFAKVIRMNEFSLHGFYRDRLVRTFYGGFRAAAEPRQPALFTGFDGKDDIPLTEVQKLYERQLPKCDPQTGIPNKPPFLVVNTALNLVKGTELAWQERKADSFTFTALAAGNYRLGYRDVQRFAQGVRLGTAMAISGAAFNPNMGYNSSTPMAFLMSVFNVRLGWWLGNPRFSRWDRKDPRNSSWVMLQEATGQTTDTNDWIHLSDGGHFDNLGLWEMVHRRCRRILVIDASQDERFSLEDLYTAIRKIRIDMGIEIVADEAPVMLFPRSARASGRYHARFTIRYGGTDPARAWQNGILLYLKPCVYGSEPPDIQEYAHKHLDFPHETTADQFFNESQFESYRKLGEWEMAQLLRDVLGLTGNAPLSRNVLMDTSLDGETRGLFSSRA